MGLERGGKVVLRKCGRGKGKCVDVLTCRRVDVGNAKVLMCRRSDVSRWEMQRLEVALA